MAEGLSDLPSGIYISHPGTRGALLGGLMSGLSHGWRIYLIDAHGQGRNPEKMVLPLGLTGKDYKLVRQLLIVTKGFSGL
jgi:hypothetical protein